jgi:hypothetical protein
LKSFLLNPTLNFPAPWRTLSCACLTDHPFSTKFALCPLVFDFNSYIWKKDKDKMGEILPTEKCFPIAVFLWMVFCLST